MMANATQLVFWGTGEFAVPIFEKLAAGQWRPDLVVSTPDAPAGRGLKPKPSPVKIAAEKLGIPVIQPADLSAIRFTLSADLFIVAAYGKILPPDLLKIPRHGSLNIHPSFLPRWRGPSPVQYAILRGDEETGVTIMLMDEEADHGAILRNAKCQMPNAKITVPELTKQLAELGAELLLETIPDWLAGKIEPQAQDETKATYAPRLKKEDGHIDWSRPAEEIERMIRAFQPWPGAYAFWQHGGKKIRLVMEKAEVRSKKEEVGWKAGMVVAEDGGFNVETSNGLLEIVRLKPEGGKSMPAEEFLRGHPHILGAILE